MKWQEAYFIGQTLLQDLGRGCEKIELAGSVRRHKAEVKDLEIVAVPKLEARQVGFWDTAPYSLLEEVLDDLLAKGILVRDCEVRRWGERYKRMVHDASGLVIELFMARPHSWGYILALRTGPAEFNRTWASHGYHGGCLPLENQLRDGELLHRGKVVSVETEAAFFKAIGLPCWPPEERSRERLERWLAKAESNGK
jgi:DNA polymerase/3'-5' exonuclease PolX